MQLVPVWTAVVQAAVLSMSFIADRHVGRDIIPAQASLMGWLQGQSALQGTEAALQRRARRVLRQPSCLLCLLVSVRQGPHWQRCC